MVAKIKFWLLQRSMSITKASLSAMILKSTLQYSLLITRSCFTGKATPPLVPAERSFSYCIITLNFEINFFGKDVSFRATMSKLFSFRYNSSSLRFDLMPLQFQNMMFVPMKAIIRYMP